MPLNFMNVTKISKPEYLKYQLTNFDLIITSAYYKCVRFFCNLKPKFQTTWL